MSSTTSRIISGGVASWAKIALTFSTQLVLVPLYLSYWTVDEYGIWIAIQAFVGILTILDFGHQSFLEFEFLRLGTDRNLQLRKTLWSGMFVGFMIGLIQILIIIVILSVGLLPFMLKGSVPADGLIIRNAGWILLFQGIAWLISGSLGGIAYRSLAPFGYYPRMSWWSVLIAFITGFAPVIAVFFGAGIMGAGIVLAVATIASSIPFFYDIFYLYRKVGLNYVSPSINLGLKNFMLSLVLAAKSMLEKASREGVRLILAPLAGVAPMAAFATMRTGANVALQGLSTLTNPLMPELMRFLNQRDQTRCEMAFSTVWIVLVVVMAPAVVLLQVIVEPIFALWTRGALTFNPLLFAFLSITVLVYALAQPAIAIIRGNNILHLQLIFSIITALVVILGIFIMVPIFGILGAGIALLISEVVGAVIYIVAAGRWMRDNGLFWPFRYFYIAGLSILISGMAIVTIGAAPNHKWLLLAISWSGLLWLAYRFIKLLPPYVIERIKSLLVKIPVIGNVMIQLKQFIFFKV